MLTKDTFSKPAGLPFTKFRLERCGQDGPSQRAVLDLALNRQARVSKSPFSKEDHMENPTAEPKSGSLTPT